MPTATLAATTVAVVWIAIGLVTTAALIAMIAALVRHAILVGRAAGRLSDELGEISSDIATRSPAAGSRAGRRRRRGAGSAGPEPVRRA